MARVTVEDCLEKVPNRFALTVLASRRARQLSESRGTPLVKCSNKSGVTALREIGKGGVRYAENVEETIRDFIEEQRRDLQALTYADVDFGSGSFDGDPDADGIDYDDDIEELVPDLTRVKPDNRNDSDDDVDTKNTMDTVERRDDDDDEESSDDDDSDDDEDAAESVEGFEDGEDIDLPDIADDEDGDADVDFDDDAADSDSESDKDKEDEED